jgi:hypothetical protein
METTPGDREHGYDDELEQEAYENAAEAGDEDAGVGGDRVEPDDPRPPDDE